MSCAYCDDTGSLSKDPYGDLDCAHCDVAGERAKLEGWGKQEGILRWSDGISTWHLWLVYQHGKAAAAQPA